MRIKKTQLLTSSFVPKFPKHYTAHPYGRLTNKWHHVKQMCFAVDFEFWQRNSHQSLDFALHPEFRITALMDLNLFQWVMFPLFLHSSKPILDRCSQMWFPNSVTLFHFCRIPYCPIYAGKKHKF